MSLPRLYQDFTNYRRPRMTAARRRMLARQRRARTTYNARRMINSTRRRVGGPNRFGPGF